MSLLPRPPSAAALALLLAAWLPAATAAEPRPYSLEAAWQRAAEQSAGLTAARAGAEASRGTAAALASARWPVVSLNAQYLRYQKSVDVALDGLRAQAQAAVDGFLGSLPVALPPLPAPVLGAVIPDALHARVADSVWRPTLTVAWPLYSGGRIEAGQAAAAAGARQADAEVLQVQDTVALELVLAYFGQQLTAQVWATGRENLARFDLHLANARRLEQQGVIPRAQRLQVEVARNAAERQALRAQHEHEAAQTLLARALREEGAVRLTTALFVATAPLPPAPGYLDGARERSPMLARLRALREVASSGVQAADAGWRPQVYGFGSYNFNARHALLPDPDWIVGVGLNFTLSGSVDRREAQAAARARERQADVALEQAGRDTETLVERSWLAVETARRQFLLLEANAEAADENLRVHGLAFREGEATAAAVIDAQVAVSVVQTQRAAAAFEYDVALARLLAAAGRLGEFLQHQARADRPLPLPAAGPPQRDLP